VGLLFCLSFSQLASPPASTARARLILTKPVGMPMLCSQRRPWVCLFYRLEILRSRHLCGRWFPDTAPHVVPRPVCFFLCSSRRYSLQIQEERDLLGVPTQLTWRIFDKKDPTAVVTKTNWFAKSFTPDAARVVRTSQASRTVGRSRFSDAVSFFRRVYLEATLCHRRFFDALPARASATTGEVGALLGGAQDGLVKRRSVTIVARDLAVFKIGGHRCWRRSTGATQRLRARASHSYRTNTCTNTCAYSSPALEHVHVLKGGRASYLVWLY
jgi:hypothetical protein